MPMAALIGALMACGLHGSKVAVVGAALVLLIAPMMVPEVQVAIGAFYANVKLSILYRLTGLTLAQTMQALRLWRSSPD